MAYLHVHYSTLLPLSPLKFRPLSEMMRLNAGLLHTTSPFISITPSKPFMSSGSWLTLHYCDIYYLSAVNYDPATTDLIFIRVNIYPWPGEGGLQLIFKPVYFIRVTIYPATIPHNISRGHYLPREVGGGCFLPIFQPIYFIRVTIYPVTLA